MPTRHTITNFLLITLALTFTTTAHAIDTIRYVNKSNTNPTQDGLTWETAFTTIQPAIDAAHDAGGGEVWVAQGSYNEERTALDNGGEPSGSVVLRDGVSVYGGFTGSEQLRAHRSQDAALTIIDGSSSLFGAPALTVVLAEQVAAPIVFSDFTITGGSASGDIFDQENRHRARGGGVYAQGELEIRNCRIVDNHADAEGGGLSGGYLAFDCYIADNTTNSMGGGAWGGNYTGSTFANNWAEDGAGGLNKTGEVRDCVFINNRCGGGGSSSGGGALRLSTGESRVVNCLFINNRAETSGGGGAIFVNGYYDENTGNYTASAEILNCTLVGNSSKFGVVINHNDSRLTIRNSVVWENGTAWVGGSTTSPVTIDNCVAPDDATNLSRYNVTNLLHDNPLFVNPAGENYRLRPQSVAIDAGTDADAPSTDLDGNARPLGDGFDIGAYEFDPEVPFEDPFDATGDTFVNAADIQHLINQVLGTTSPITDLNNDGTTNAADLQLIINRVLGVI